MGTILSDDKINQLIDMSWDIEHKYIDYMIMIDDNRFFKEDLDMFSQTLYKISNEFIKLFLKIKPTLENNPIKYHDFKYRCPPIPRWLRMYFLNNNSPLFEIFMISDFRKRFVHIYMEKLYINKNLANIIYDYAFFEV
jgi:hypothetical protein